MVELLGGKMEWPHCKGSVVPSNVWNTKLDILMEKLNSVQDDRWWICDVELKYLTIRLDTRDNAFILLADGRKDNDHTRIDPQRVITAIDKYVEKYKDNKERSKDV